MAVNSINIFVFHSEHPARAKNYGMPLFPYRRRAIRKIDFLSNPVPMLQFDHISRHTTCCTTYVQHAVNFFFWSTERDYKHAALSHEQQQ